MGGPLLAGGFAAAALPNAVTAAPAPTKPAGPTTSGAVTPGTQFEIYGDGRDSTALWQQALAAIEKAGRGCIVAYGEHQISANLSLPDVASLEIIGYGCTLKKTKPDRLAARRSPSASSARISSKTSDWNPSMMICRTLRWEENR